MSILHSFNVTSTTEIYTLSLHDALPILRNRLAGIPLSAQQPDLADMVQEAFLRERSADHVQHGVEKQNVVVPRQKAVRSEEHTSELQSQSNLVCRLLLEKKKNQTRMFDL